MARTGATEELPKRVGIWIRVSTEDQAKGESPEHHERRARSYAEAKDWHVAQVYNLSGVSGKSVMGHPETERMLEDMKGGRITGLIFSKLARLARNTRELLDFADIFRDHGADLISLQEAIDTSSPAGRLFYTMIAAMAQWEREEIAERVAASVPVRAKLGKPLGGAAPFGYRWVDKKLIPDPNEAPIRRLVYELFVKEKRKKRVARILNERGYRTRRGAPFTDSAIARMIEDPTAKGWRRANYTKSRGEGKRWDYKPEDEWVWHPVEAIVPEELWEEANTIVAEQRRGRKPARKTVHLFSGIAFCACGGKMYVPSNSPKYICWGCRNKIPEEDLEAVFQEQLHAFFLSPEDIAEALAGSESALREREELLSVLQKERDFVQSEMDRVYRLYIDEEIESHGFGERNRPLDARRKQLDAEIPELAGAIDSQRIHYLSSDEIVREAQDLYGRWDSLTFDEKREIVESITERIEVGDGDIEIHLYYEPPRPPTEPRPPDPSGDRGNKATQKHGFAAAIHWKRAGKAKRAAARANTTLPSSRIWRSASRLPRSNSGSSSRKRTPLWASETSPGRGGVPPPRRPALVAEWWGARKGRVRMRGVAGSRPPATLQIRVVSRASACESGGSRLGSTRARSVLPEPGAPRMSRPCPPAAETSSARLGPSCPRTTAKSGPVAEGGDRASS